MPLEGPAASEFGIVCFDTLPIVWRVDHHSQTKQLDEFDEASRPYMPASESVIELAERLRRLPAERRILRYIGQKLPVSFRPVLPKLDGRHRDHRGRSNEAVGRPIADKRGRKFNRWSQEL